MQVPAAITNAFRFLNDAYAAADEPTDRHSAAGSFDAWRESMGVGVIAVGFAGAAAFGASVGGAPAAVASFSCP